MGHVFMPRIFEPPVPIALTITGTGDASSCYVVIAGTKYTAAESELCVWPGSKIACYLKANSGDTVDYPAYLTVDGATVATITNTSTAKKTNWTVPSNATAISISLSYSSTGNNRIRITTS